jgi:hypothetical protein
MISAQVRSLHLKDGAVALDVRHGRMFNLNPVGSRIVALLEAGTASEARIVEAIQQEFDIDRDRARADVHEFLNALEEHKLFEGTACGEMA